MEGGSPANAMPWVGLYVCIASLVCTLAMAADAFQGIWQWKLWFPCRFFTINATSITLIAIAMKLPVDLNTDISNHVEVMAKFVSMLANFLPSLGLMDDKELVMNIVALGILIITVTVNVLIEFSTTAPFTTPMQMLMLLLSLPLPFSVALTVSASRKILQHRFKEFRRLDSDHQEIKFSFKGHKHNVKKYWMMAETGNPQFAIPCTPVSSAFGVICSLIACLSIYFLFEVFVFKAKIDYEKSDYKWSLDGIFILQSIGAIVGSIAPVCRCLSATSHFNLSKKWSKNHLNVLRVEKHWTQRLHLWKHSHVPSYIPGRHRKKVFDIIKNMVLNFCIGFQTMFVVMCNAICLITRSFLILCSCCFYFCKSLLKRFKEEPNTSSGNVIPDMEEYTRYVLRIEEEAKLSKRILINMLTSITRLLHESEEKEPRNLMKLLEKSKGFNGVVQFDNDQVPPLHQEETQNCWSLVTVTLTAIALALPNNASMHVKGLLDGMREGLEFVKHIEKSLNANGDLTKARKAARRVWTDIEVYFRWLQINLQEDLNVKTSKEILQWLSDEAAKIVIRLKTESLDQLDHKFIAASSMYRISQTILLHCSEQENWPTDEELFEFISTIIADLLCACFTNLPRLITMKCHEDAIEKREDSIRTAAQLLGKSKKILKIHKARQLPNIDPESMAYIDKWHALPKSQIPNDSAWIQPSPSSSNESIMTAAYGGHPADYDGQPAYGAYKEEKKSMYEMGTGLAVGVASGLLGGLAIAEGVDYVEDEIAEDAADKVEDDLGYDVDDD